MSSSQWHKLYTAQVAAPPALLFRHIHYSFEQQDETTCATRWLVLDITMPRVLRSLRRFITASFDKEDIRTMAAVKKYAEAHSVGKQ